MDGRIERALVFIGQAQGRAKELRALLTTGEAGKRNLQDINALTRSLEANLASAEIELGKPEDEVTETPGR